METEAPLPQTCHPGVFSLICTTFYGPAKDNPLKNYKIQLQNDLALVAKWLGKLKLT